MRIKKGNVDNFIEHHDALWGKFREIGIYNLTHYLKVRALGSINLQLSNANLPELFTSIINYINEGIIIAQQIRQANYTGTVIEEVCYIKTDQYNEDLRGVGDETLEKLCHKVACL